ncbi:hypothetical protein G5V65_19690 [Rhodobacter sp. HX-7-19]|uniref:Uncharacterized protein n=1 Tax=Paragemmobacter kunshanensis TaxID=2583234 RepID=A0A6M1U004_9RHOB|nr:hypothetical protein [Rhodobacter kunshanensis]NGQ93117.1 hypothetical protein [Rhodobacter kunshanensis]
MIEGIFGLPPDWWCRSAAPNFNYQFRVVAAISLWAATKVASIAELAQHARLLTETADRISGRFGAMA